jgi:hypothetical protein
MKTIQKYLPLLMTFSLFGCAGLLENRSFIGEMERETDGVFIAGRDFNVVAGDSGRAYRSRDEIMARTPASAHTKELRDEYDSMRYELQKKEEKLTEVERANYDEVSPYLESLSEKIYYLNLSPNERTAWAQTRGFEMGSSLRAVRASDDHGRGIASLDPRGLADREIGLGMAKDQVVERWGNPQRVEVAGDPRHQNERWSFYENGRLRHVFFESGRVQGWSIQ